jgi:hypothetical protein
MLLPRCSSLRTSEGDKKLQKAGKQAVLDEIDAMAVQGLRCLGLAIKTSVRTREREGGREGGRAREREGVGKEKERGDQVRYFMLRMFLGKGGDLLGHDETISSLFRHL